MGRWLRALGVGAALAATLPGCMAHARGELVYDHPVTYVDDAPARVDTYPSTYYHGRPAYLVDGRWYYRSGPRWVYFREEPRELYTYRTRQMASPRYRDDGRRGERYSDVVEKRRDYRDDRRAEQYRDERRAQQRAEERRAADRRAEMRRVEERRDAERRRAEDRRRSERRADERRDEQRRAVEKSRRVEESRAEQRRAERKERVAEKRPNDNRRRNRDDRDRRSRDD